MDKGYIYVRNINPRKQNQSIRFRVVTSWLKPAFGNVEETMEYILMDEEDVKIQASIKTKLKDRVGKLLDTNATVLISNFVVAAYYDNKYASLNSKYKLNLFHATKVTPVSDWSGSMNGFKFVAFSDILSNKLKDNDTVDVIGAVVSIADPIPFTKNNVEKKRVTAHLMDSDQNTVKCTLFDHHADELASLLAQHESANHKILVLQTAKITEYNRTQSIQNAFNGTKLYMNPDFPEVSSFAESMSSHGCGPITVARLPATQSQSTYSSKPDFINGELINLDEISAHLKVATYVTLATIDSLHVEESWWYLGYHKCKNKAVQLTEHDQVNPADFPNGLKCKGCYPKPPPSLGPSYKLQIRVINDTGSASFTLFDRDVMKLMKISCYDLRNKYLDDEFAFPEEFNQLIGNRLLFMVSVSAYNKTNNYQVYTVENFTDDEDIINTFKKAHGIDQDDVDYDSLTNSVDGPPHINLSSKDAISCTRENVLSVDLTFDTAESPAGKRTFETINDGPTFAKSSSSKTKKRLLEVNTNN